MKKGEDYIAIGISYYCHNGKGEYLLNKRSINCRDEHGRWDFGGGGIDFGDTIEGTLKKELKEEYGADPIKYEFLGYRDVFREQNEKKTHWIQFDFKVLIDPTKVINGEPHKFDAIEWFSLDNLPTPLHSQMLTQIGLYKDKLN